MIVTIDGVDRTDCVYARSINISQQKDNRVDRCTFRAIDCTPELNNEVEITLDGAKQFAGVILSAESQTVANDVEYSIKAVDYTHWLTRTYVTQRYEDTTINAIINDLLTREPRISATFVDADIAVDSIAFNQISLSEAINKLAEVVNYSWYVDYEKNLHFFAQQGVAVHTTLSDTSANFLWQSLQLSRDLSQLKNRVTVRGSDTEGLERTVKRVASTGQTEFGTEYRFAKKPTVTKDGTAVDVGVEYLDEEADFDAFWSFREKYVRFKTEMTGGEAINMSAKPLLPIIVEVQDDVSVGTFGQFDFAISDENIDTQDKAISRALAELNAYATSLVEGSFETYTAGFRPGQRVRINVSAHNVDEDFIIQSVTCKDFAQGSDYPATWKVEVVTAQTIGVVRILQRLLRNEEIDQNERETLLKYFDFDDDAGLSDTAPTVTAKTGPYYITDAAGNVTTGEPAVVGFSKVAA